MKENTVKDIDVYSKESTVIERPEPYNIGVKVGWTAPAKWWNWLFNACTSRLKELFNTTTSIHNEIKNAVGGTLDPKSDTQLKDRLAQMKKELADMTAEVQSKLDAFEDTKAKPNGIASLDPDGRIPYSQLPESAMEFKGNWNASTNTPTLADGTGDLGDMYLVSVEGTVDLGSGNIIFLEGDRVIYNQAGKWEKISGGSVKSVNEARPDATGNVDVIVDAGHIANGAVTTTALADSAVTTAKIAAKAVDTKNIADGAVDRNQLGLSAVDTKNIATSAVTSAKIADGAVTANKCAGDVVKSVNGSKPTNGDVTISVPFISYPISLFNGGTGANTASMGSYNLITNSIPGSDLPDEDLFPVASAAEKRGYYHKFSTIFATVKNKILAMTGWITAGMCKSGSNLYMHYIAMVETGVSNSYYIYFTILTNERTLDSIAKIANCMHRQFGVEKYIVCTGRAFIDGINCVALTICAESTTKLLVSTFKPSNYGMYGKLIEQGVNHSIISDTIVEIIKN